MNFAQGIRDFILADTTIAGLVGNRVYNFYVNEQDAVNTPWIAFRLGLPEPVDNLATTSHGEVVAWKCELLLSAGASHPDLMLGLSYKLQEIFHQYSGEIAGVEIDRIIFQSYTDDWAINPTLYFSNIVFEINFWDKPNFKLTT